MAKHIDTQQPRVPPCSGDVRVDHPGVQRPRPVERVQHDEVLEPPGSQPPQDDEILKRVVLSVNGKTGHVRLTTTDIPEGSNLYFTANRAEEAARYAFSATSPINYDINTGVFSLGVVPISFGGTGATTAVNALNNLLPSQLGNAGRVLQTDGTITSWVDVGLGNVSSVGLSAPSEFTVGGSPVTSSGTLSLAWLAQQPGLVFASPALSTGGIPSFRALVYSDLPDISGYYVPYSGATANLNMGAYSVTASLFSGPVTALKTITGAVTIDSSSAPSVGQALVATSPTTATWQTVSVGGGGDTVKVSATDTTSGYLQQKLVGTSGRVTLTQHNPAGNEYLQIDVPNLVYLYPSNALSLDSSTLLAVGLTRYSGRLSAGNTNYSGTAPAGSSVSYIIAGSPSFNLLTPNPSTTFNFADSGNLDVVVNSVAIDSFDLGAAFNELERNGIQSYTPAVSANGYITVSSVEWYNSFPLWQKGNASFSISATDLRQGYNAILVQHTGILSQPDQSASVVELFYDMGTSTPTITAPTLVESTPTAFTYISGVKYYTSGQAFTTSAVASNCFDNTYHAVSPVVYTSNAFGSGIIDWNDASVSGVSNPPYITDTMTITDKTISVAVGNRDYDVVLTLTPRKPWVTGTPQSSSAQSIMVDSVGASSTDTSEYFDDEAYRLPPDTYDSLPITRTGQWDSSLPLVDGNAQVSGGALIYPSQDYTTAMPAQTVNYSAFSGPQVYYRSMYTALTNSDGVLQLVGLTGADVGPVGSGDVNVEIKLPTQTGWLDLGKPFDYGTFTGIDGDGCQVAQSGSDWTWSVGTFATANSGFMYIVRITLLSNTKSISGIREIGPGW